MLTPAKKTIAVIFSLIFALSLTACSDQSQMDSTADDASDAATEQTEDTTQQ